MTNFGILSVTCPAVEALPPSTSGRSGTAPARSGWPRWCWALIAAALATVGAAPPSHSAEFSAPTNFVLRCSGCHGMDGEGNPAGGIPDLRGKVGVFARSTEGRRYVANVPGVVGSGLNPRETAAVLSYVMERYAGASLPGGFQKFSADEVVKLRTPPVMDVVKLRRNIVAKLRREGIHAASYPWP